MQEEKKFKCKICWKYFASTFNLRRHFTSKHEENACKYKCSECEYSTSRLDTIKEHKSIHTQMGTNAMKPNNILCAMCNYMCRTENIMRQHYTSKHEINIFNKECLTFQSEEKFYEWKLSVENIEENQFVKKRENLYLVNGNSKVNFYCFRNGNFKSTGLNIRHEKFNGSNKINGYCPARMNVIILPSGEVTVEFFKTHVGHESEVGRMRLCENERGNIAKRIALKIPFDNILDNVRTSSSTDNFGRLRLVTRQDLYNIARDYNLKAEGVRHNNESISVQSWVEDMQNTGNIILMFKAQGSLSQEFPHLKEDDFVLIIMNEKQREMLKRFSEKCVCMDSTHGLNSYGFQLTTLLVLDDLNQGFPCTFMFSNRTDCKMLEIMLWKVRNALGVKLKTKVFMSDMANEFFNAWLAVMEQPKFRLFCSWHVTRAWSRNLCKIKNTDKRHDIYKLIRTLMEESDSNEFQIKLEEALKIMKEDDDTAKFGDYFQREYQQTVSNWAYCYRRHCGVNTNMHLERMHGVIKHIYLKGLKPRLGIAIHTLMRYLRDQEFEEMITKHKGKITSKLRALRQHHKSSLKLDENEVTKSDFGDLWHILSNDKSTVYVITKGEDNCRCNLICTYCNICMHRYACTCPDYAIKFNMCKHIHLVHRIVNQNKTEMGDFFCASEEAIVSEMTTETCAKPENGLKRKEISLNKFKSLLEDANVSNMDYIDRLIRETHATVLAENSVENMPIQQQEGQGSKRKKMERQARFVSKKKKLIKKTKCRSNFIQATE